MRNLFLFLFLFAVSLISKADEGMWLLPKIKELNIDSMRKLGFSLTAEDLYSITKPSIKDAIIVFGKGCTGEIISGSGLILTNHHCGYEAIQKLSSVNHDYLKEGFWAKNQKCELSCKGLTVSFLEKFDNVTDSILPFLTDSMSEKSRQDKIKEISQRLEKRATKDNKYTADVREFYGGNEYYLIVYKVFNDVRLVGAPPSSIGKFGADTDNWMWPRHTGDFSIFRVYSDSSGVSTNVDSTNVPLKTPKFLPISLKGYEKGSFAMVMGNPGTTERYFTSSQVQELTEITNALRIKIRGARQEILLNDMSHDPKTRIQYASKYARSSNYWKYSIGQNKGLKRLNVIERKKENELKLNNWICREPNIASRYGNCIKNIATITDTSKKLIKAYTLYAESIIRGIELYTVVRALVPIYEELNNSHPRNTELTKAIADAKESLEEFFLNYNAETDRKIAPIMLKQFSEEIDDKFKFMKLLEIEKKYNGNMPRFADKMYSKTFLTNKEKVFYYLQSPGIKQLNNDPAFKFFYSAIMQYRDIYKQIGNYKTEIKKNQRAYIASLLDYNKTMASYPDANSSMRLTYGTVQDYTPSDAIHFNYQTTLNGVIEKEDSTNWEFVVPPRLKEIYKSQNYKPYSTTKKMPVAFITNNDITGGNSGSPVMNANGEMIGIAFDGNWEAMSGNIIFEPDLQRTISVDIRYVLMIIDKFGEAGYLIKEMNIRPN